MVVPRRITATPVRAREHRGGDGVTRNGLGRSIAAIITGYLTTNVMTVAGAIVVVVGKLVEPEAIYTRLIWVAVIGQIAGGYVAAAVARERELLHGFILALVLDAALLSWAGQTIFFTPGAGPLVLTMKILLSLCAPVFGAYLRQRHRRKVEERSELRREIAEEESAEAAAESTRQY